VKADAFFLLVLCTALFTGCASAPRSSDAARTDDIEVDLESMMRAHPPCQDSCRLPAVEQPQTAGGRRVMDGTLFVGAS
jgi:hypothetical protein